MRTDLLGIASVRREPPIRPLAVLTLVLALLASACAGDGATESSKSAAEVLRAGVRAASDATSVRGDLRLRLELHGEPRLSGPVAGFLNGPVELRVSSRTARLDDRGALGKLDATFAVEASGLSFEGRALSADGKRVYVQLPVVLGPDWYYVDVPAKAARPGGADHQELRRLLRGLDVGAWLENDEVTNEDGQDRVEADLAVGAVVDALVQLVEEKTGEKLSAKDRAELAKIERAVRRAHMTAAFDESTHLPAAIGADLTVEFPADVRDQTKGVTGFDLRVRGAYSDWNEDFDVTPPADARPLRESSLLRGGLFSAA
jgi:hypothetical protein